MRFTLRTSPLLALLALSVSCASSQATSSKGAQASNTTQKSEGPKKASKASKLPDFTLETIDGGEFTLSDHLGDKVVVMSFWATWCMPCLAELPHLEDLYQEEKDNGLMIVALSMDEPTTVAEVAPTAQRLGLTLPVALDTEQRAVRLYNRARSAPMTVVIDKKGRIVHASAGYNPGDEVSLAEEVRGLLSAP